MIYLIILITLIILSIQYDINGRTINKNRWYNVMLLVFILVAGLRYRLGGDTIQYLERFYYKYPDLENFSFEDYPIGMDPLFVLLNSFVISIGGKFYIFQLVHATIINVLIFKYIKRHSKYIFSCLFFYAIGCYTHYNMEILRGSLSIVLCLYAFDFIIEKKYFKAMLLMFVSCLFHIQTLLICFAPILFFLRFNKKSCIIIFILFTLSSIILNLGDYFFYLSFIDVQTKYDYYNDNDDLIQNGNPIFLIITYLPGVIYTIYSIYYIKRKSPNCSLLEYERIFMVGILFLILQFSVGIFYRYTDYFRIYFAMLYGELFVLIVKKAYRMKSSNAIAHGVFFFLPMIILFVVQNSLDGKGRRYYPYSSVIEKSVDIQREKQYKSFGMISANENKY